MADPRAPLLRGLLDDGWVHKPSKNMYYVVERYGTTVQLLWRKGELVTIREQTRRTDGTWEARSVGTCYNQLPHLTYRYVAMEVGNGWVLNAEGCRTVAGPVLEVYAHKPVPGKDPKYGTHYHAATAQLSERLNRVIWAWCNIEDTPDGSPLVDMLMDLMAECADERPPDERLA